MNRQTPIYAIWVLFAAVAAGCGHNQVRKACPEKPPPPELPVIARSLSVPDVSSLPTGSVHATPTRPSQVRRLTAVECRTNAVRNAPYAGDLDQHPENESTKCPTLHPGKPNPEEARANRLVRGYVADDFRNRAAGEALEQYFQLALAEGQFDLLMKSHAELKGQLAAAEETVRRGLADRAGVDTLRVQVLDLEAQIAQLEAGIGGLNESLRVRLGLPAHGPHFLMPDDPLRVGSDDVNADEAVRTGLQYRPDLNLIRTLLADDGKATHDLSQAVLRQVSPLLARLRDNPLVSIILPFCNKRDQSATRCQLQSLLESRERQAEAEIRAAILSLRGYRVTATSKAAEVRRQEAVVQELEKRAAVGQQVTVELTKARLDGWKAQSELRKAATDWNSTEAKLRQAMGLLIRE